MSNYVLSFVFTCITTSFLYAHNGFPPVDTTELPQKATIQDTTSILVKKDTSSLLLKTYKWAFHTTHKNPQLAVIYSAILPGAGQFYNRQLYKLPFVYGAIGGILYIIDFNHYNYTRYKKAYIQRLAGEPDEFIGLIRTAEGIKQRRDLYRKNLELSYIGSVAVYGIIILDAFVSAHLSDFDVSDDLSLKLTPVITPFQPYSGLAIGLVVRL